MTHRSILHMFLIEFPIILTENLSGNLTVSQPGVKRLNKQYISTTNQTNITAHIHDPNYWILHNTQMVQFYWFVNEEVC